MAYRSGIYAAFIWRLNLARSFDIQRQKEHDKTISPAWFCGIPNSKIIHHTLWVIQTIHRSNKLRLPYKCNNDQLNELIILEPFLSNPYQIDIAVSPLKFRIRSIRRFCFSGNLFNRYAFGTILQRHCDWETLWEHSRNYFDETWSSHRSHTSAMCAIQMSAFNENECI